MAGNTMRAAGRSEARFLMEAMERGWEIAQPFHHCNPYDFVIRRPGGPWETVQVKTAFASLSNRGTLPARAVSLRRMNEKGQRAYHDGDFDLLFVVDGSACWLIPWSVVAARKSQVLISGKRYASYKQ